MNLNKPITYRYFKTLSNDLQILYYNHLVEEFWVFQSDIAKMFGVGNNTLSTYLKKRGLSVHKLTNKKTDYQRRLENESKWQLFLSGEYRPNKESEELDISNTSESDEKASGSSFGEKLASYRLEFKCVSGWLDIFEMLSKIPLPADATITVSVGDTNG